MQRLIALAVVAFAGWAAPAAAQPQVISFTGTSFLAAFGSPMPALAAFDGQAISGSFTIDTLAAGFQTGTAPGGFGQVGALTGAVTAGQFTLSGTGGAVSFTSTSADAGTIVLTNDGRVLGNPALRNDIMGYTTGATVVNGMLQLPYAATGPLSADVFLGSLFFGRSQRAAQPTLIADVNARDFGAVLTGPAGDAPFLQLVFRQGAPQSSGALDGLPLRSLQIGITQISVTTSAAVPESANWLLLIVGFGLVGTAQRRRQLQIN